MLGLSKKDMYPSRFFIEIKEIPLNESKQETEFTSKNIRTTHSFQRKCLGCNRMYAERTLNHSYDGNYCYRCHDRKCLTDPVYRNSEFYRSCRDTDAYDNPEDEDYEYESESENTEEYDSEYDNMTDSDSDSDYNEKKYQKLKQQYKKMKVKKNKKTAKH